MSKVNKPSKSRHRRGEEGSKEDDPSSSKQETIEDIGTNFMKHVQQTEEDNVELRKKTETLEGKVKDMSENERVLAAENETLKKELEELTEHHQKLKDENNELLKKVADVRKESDAKVAVLEDRVKQQECHVKELEESKAKLVKKLGDMEENTSEFNEKLTKQSSVISSLKSEMDESEGRIKSDHKAELKKLNGIIEEKEELLDSVRKELDETISQTSKSDQTDQDEIKKLQDMLKRREKELQIKEDVIEPLEKERSILSAEISKLRDEVKTKNKEIEELRRKIESLTSSKKSMEKTIKSIKSENNSLKSQQDDNLPDNDEEIERLRERIIQMASKIDVMKTTETAMAQLLKSKEHHILDLRSEITELRNVSNVFKRDLSELRSRQRQKSVNNEKYDDMANNHKRVLEENKRLRTMFATKAMEETNTNSEHVQLRAELDDVTRKLKLSQERVLKLEGWMDQIFKNSDYDVVLKSNTPRDSVVSLPEIPFSSTSTVSHGTRRHTRRRGGPVRRYTPRSIRELPGKF